MVIETEKDVITIIQQDEWMMELLKITSTLSLPDWWICAGFVRSKIWDTLHNFNDRTSLPDIDVIYYDSSNIEEQVDGDIEGELQKLLPNIPWSVKNQARMHLVNQIPPYTSAVDAISKFPETATALGVKLDQDDKVILVAPHGVEDVLNMYIKPTPYFSESKEKMRIYEERVGKKNWKETWDKLKV